MKKNLVFSSVGDNTNFHNLFIGDKMNYDVFVIYYGDNNETYQKYKSKVHFIEKRKGSKFQNFKYFYDNYPSIIQNYELFFILDDDILIDVEKINKMFEISKKYNLSICGPSFSGESLISHEITKHKPGRLLTYTSFVELNVPLFSKPAIENLMNHYDNKLIGWGIDYLSIWSNGADKKKDYAIIHSIKCVNPHPSKKINSKRRELSLIGGYEKRSEIWKEFAKKIGCNNNGKKLEYETIPL